MNYKTVLIILVSIFLHGCDPKITKNKEMSFIVNDRYSNSGFALIYNDDLKNVRKIENRSLNIYHKSLKKKTKVKITNPINGNSLIAEVKSNKVKFSNFYNSILSPRIAEDLKLDIDEPYIEITLISNDSTFVAKKAKTFDEESKVAEKAPIDGIQINDLNTKKVNKKFKKKNTFSYSIKVADFYYRNTALLMLGRIEKELSIKKISIIQLSKTKYRLLIGPFNDIKSLKKTFENMNSLNFENLEILKNA